MIVLRLVIGRVLAAVLTPATGVDYIFAAVELLPGDVASRILGRNATEVSLAALRLKLNLGAPGWSAT